MKTLSLLVLVFGFMNAFASTPIEREVEVTGVYIPSGLDDNDRSEFIITGNLPNTCHRSPNSQVEIRGKQLHISMTALTYEDSDYFCPPMQIPFMERSQVGLLAAGDYELFINNKKVELQRMVINKAKHDRIDDFVYANINSIEDLGEGRFLFKGLNPSSCYEFDRFETIYNGKNTLSVLPIMKLVADECPMKMTPFELEFDLPKDLKAKKLLLHIRSMNGNSVNFLM